MKKMIEELLRKVLGEMLGAESLANLVKGAAEKLLADKEWITAIAGKVKTITEEEKGKAEREPAAVKEEPTETPAPPAAVDTDTGEPSISWAYGGFNGAKAAVALDAVLDGVTLKGDTLTISWKKGDCRNIGATSKSDASHTVACLFLSNGKGGKFEWISSDRKTRSVKNIKDGYNKWPKSALDNGGKLWFCIAGVKDDQKTSNGKRTALVEVERA